MQVVICVPDLYSVSAKTQSPGIGIQEGEGAAEYLCLSSKSVFF